MVLDRLDFEYEGSVSVAFAVLAFRWSQVVWFLEREMSAGTTTLQLKYPVIVWAKVMTVAAGQVIRWA